jgi:hypothetical protein
MDTLQDLGVLQLRPNCELCDKDLPADSAAARICSYECTFCRDCVDQVLHNVCPNCGGGFTPRPVRPKTARRSGVSLEHQPAAEQRVQSKYSTEEIAEFVQALRQLEPELR